MKQFYKIILAYFAIMLFLLIGLNITLYITLNREDSYFYKVEINRLYDEIAKNGYSDHLDLSSYPSILSVEYLSSNATDNEIKQFYQSTNKSFLIKPIGDETIDGYVKFIYSLQQTRVYYRTILIVNISFILLGGIVFIILLYVKSRIIKPFHQIQEMPYELSKGHLTNSIKENKNRFFGRFVWGLNMLRENLESHKKKEFQLEKEKKTIVLSISHDIKTPLSSIKLYAKALQQGLYQEKEKQQEVLVSIDQKVDEIEQFVNEIIKTSKEDFLNIEVNNSEFYLSDLINRLQDYYQEKLGLLKTEFIITEYPNCIIYGDIERCLEVLENIIENAMKYGDGKQIELRFTREENCQLITVANSGNSLPLNETVHIFESFWRGSNTTDKQGSGLGLYICRQILSKMNGDIFANPTPSEMQVTVVLKMQ